MNHNLKKKTNKLHEGSSGTFLLSVLRNWEIVIIKMTKLLRGNVESSCKKANDSAREKRNWPRT